MVTTTGPIIDVPFNRRSRRTALIEEGKEKLANIPWQSIAGGIFWGSLGALSGIIAVDFFMIGGPAGILLGIVYLGLTSFDFYLMVSAIMNNSILGF